MTVCNYSAEKVGLLLPNIVDQAQFKYADYHTILRGLTTGLTILYLSASWTVYPPIDMSNLGCTPAKVNCLRVQAMGSAFYITQGSCQHICSLILATVLLSCHLSPLTICSHTCHTNYHHTFFEWRTHHTTTMGLSWFDAGREHQVCRARVIWLWRDLDTCCM